LLLFSGEGANVEMGVTNELFPMSGSPGTVAMSRIAGRHVEHRSTRRARRHHRR